MNTMWPIETKKELSRKVIGKVTGNLSGIRPMVREELDRLSRLGVKPDRMWDDGIVQRMAYLSARLDRVMAIFLLESGEIAEVRLGGQDEVDLGNPPTNRCIRTGFGEIRTLPETERLMLLEGTMKSVVCVGVGMALPGDICMGWRSPAGTGGVILYGPIWPRKAG